MEQSIMKSADDSQFRDNVSRRIINRTNELGLAQKDIVKTLGSPKSTVNGWYTGLSQPRGLDLLNLCRVLKCSVEWLFSGEGAVAAKSQSLAFDVFDGVWNADYSDGAPFYMAPKLDSDGVGRLQLDSIPLMRHVFERLSSIRGAAWHEVTDDTASPQIRATDIVLIDTLENSFAVSGAYYVLAYGGQLRVHQAFVNMDGSISLSDAVRGESQTISPDDVKVAGRVFFRGGHF